MNLPDQLLKRAREVAKTVESWADLSNLLFNPYDGIVTSAYRTRAEREAFIKTEQYAKINQLLEDAIDKFGLVEGATPIHTGSFTVKIPKSLHMSLDLEAEDEGVSMYQLIVAKLSTPLSVIARPAQKKPKRRRVAS